MQLDKGCRGFSFSHEGPLDMRMDLDSDLNAADIVNHWSEEELIKIFRDYGEEPRWRRAARAIVERRKKKAIKTTKELADLIKDTLKTPIRSKLHPATLIFQALRIAVNQELEAIATGIAKAIDFLAPNGRIGVLSFHRLEDRIVKNIFKLASTPKRNEITGKKREDVPPLLRLLTKKPLTPTRDEISLNPRSRSAKLRFAEKIRGL